MKFAKRFLGVTLSIAMLATQVVPAMAVTEVNPDPETTHSGTNGTGNVLDFSYAEFTVPTTVQMALNPNKYPINLRYHEIAAGTAAADNGWANTSKYYTKDENGKYEMIMPQPADAAALATANADEPVYEVKAADVATNQQVISLNYGLVNKSTEKMTAQMTLSAEYTIAEGSEDKEGITFVDEVAYANPYVENTNPNGAQEDELKMYLEVVSGNTLKAVDQYTEVADTATYNNKLTYYEKAEDGTFEETTEDVTTDAKLQAYIKGGAYVYTIDPTEKVVGVEVTKENLADAAMTPFTAGKKALTSEVGTPTKASAEVAYKTDAATYDLKRGAFADLTTTQAELKKRMTITSLGTNGAFGFTLDGAINDKADWTEAAATQIKFTPIYKVTKIDETKVTVADVNATDAPGMVTVGPQVSMTSAGVITMNGFTDDLDYAGLWINYVDENGQVVDEDLDRSVTWDDSKYKNSDGTWKTERQLTATLSDDYVAFFDGSPVTVILVLSDEDGTQKSVTKTIIKPAS